MRGLAGVVVLARGTLIGPEHTRPHRAMSSEKCTPQTIKDSGRDAYPNGSDLYETPPGVMPRFRRSRRGRESLARKATFSQRYKLDRFSVGRATLTGGAQRMAELRKRQKLHLVVMK
jgi:hypothetical protein